MEILFFRFVLAYLTLLAIKPKFIKPISIKQEALFLIASIAGISLYQYLENLSLNYTTASNVSIIGACSVFFTAIFSIIFLKDKKVNRFFFFGFIISIIGVALVSYNAEGEIGMFSIGDIIALGSTILWALYSITVKIISKYDYNPTDYVEVVLKSIVIKKVDMNVIVNNDIYIMLEELNKK